MRTASKPSVPHDAPAGKRPDGEGRRPRLARLAPAAGPLLIAAAVLAALRGFAFTDLLTNQHPDIMAQWLPRYCFLGRSLAGGDIPLWNPYQMTGMPYASDPQSGWLYLPAMALFAAIPCSRALGLFIALQPLMAGLGLWWFLRREGLSRTAATAGGLSLALLMAGSTVGISLPFAGMLAWTPILLVAASGFLGTDRPVARFGWLALGALAWGQVASAHLSHGVVMASLLLVVYVGARVARAVRHEGRTPWREAALALAFLAFLPLANLAVFLPRLDLVPHTSLRGGYEALGEHLAQVAGIDDRPLAEAGVWSAWPLGLASTPGAYAGAAILLAIPAALRARGKRYLVAAFGLAGLISWVLTLHMLIGADWFRSLVLRLPYGDVYLHNPGRLRFVMLVVAPVLGAVGLHGLMASPPSRRGFLSWLGAGAAIFLALPLVLGARPVRWIYPVAAAAVALPILLGLAGAGPRWATGRARWLLPAVLAVELLGVAVWGQSYGGRAATGLEPPDQVNLNWSPLQAPAVRAGEYLEAPRFVAEIGGRNGRYISWVPPAAYFQKGYLFTQDPEEWPALENSRGMLFEIPDALGYSPVQLSRYWSYVRATNQVPIFYNAAVLQEPTLSDARILGARYLIAPTHIEPRLPGKRVLREGRFDLWEIRGYQRRASVVADWYVAPRASVALLYVLQPAFDPRELVVLEGEPGLERDPEAPPRSGTAAYRQEGIEEAVVTVESSAPALVLVRNAWDRNWTATVDGEPAPVLRADYLLQAVPVPAGSHEVRLVYRDPMLYAGLAASAVAWGALGAAAATAAVIDRRRRYRRSSEDEGSREGSREGSGTGSTGA